MTKIEGDRAEKILREIATEYGAVIKCCYFVEDEEFKFYAIFPGDIIISVIFNEYSSGFEDDLFEMLFEDIESDGDSSGYMTIENIVAEIESRLAEKGVTKINV